jgi:UDP-N-acetylmuramoyl-L-alanyl-D-glutamate--2,6-diaminopimelate ligase
VPRRDPVSLEQLLAPIREAGLLLEAHGDLQTPIAQLSHDSRAVEPGACFFALTGAEADGHLFFDKAVYHGATAAVCERLPEDDLPGLRAVVRVTDARAALAEAASVFFGQPSRALRLIGITGTNGKTTVAFLLHHALQSLGWKTGMIGTVEIRIGDRVVEATHTTPDTVALNALLDEMVATSCAACVMEVSSHALAQERVRGQRFSVGVFTNLTHDHLDYHGSFEAYGAAKARLFTGLDADAAAVVNRDDPAWNLMVRGTPAGVVTYGRASHGHHSPSGVDAEIAFSIEENAISGLRLRIDGESRRFRLAGAFNAYNLVAAYGTLRALGVGRAEAFDALEDAPPVPGRLETLLPEHGTGPVAVVDYAHTPDALENVLRTVRDMLPRGGHLAVVFGCGGDRDRFKRPLMGHIAEELADRVYLTSDNPRTEDPDAILRDVATGMTRQQATIIPDRAEAIREAVAAATPADVVVVAGKGHEPYQIVGHEKRPFDDREHVRAALKRID